MSEIKAGANSRQIGGSHYSASIQHWDIVENYGIGYIEGCASKYVTRARKKNGEQDLQKCIHYIEKLIEIGRPPRGRVPIPAVLEFCKENGLSSLESAVVIELLTWEHVDDLRRALKLAEELLQELYPAKPGAQGI